MTDPIGGDISVDQILNFKKANLAVQVQTSVLKEALDAQEAQGAALLKLLDSVSGTNVDIRA